MDPLISANLATHQMSARRQRPRRGGVDPLSVGQEDWGGLAWSALPDAPVVFDRPRNTDVVRQLLAALLRRAAARLARTPHSPGIPKTSG